MSEKSKTFQDIAGKLAAPNKRSTFERQKAEAEAKRIKEQEETAAVYADFVKSFDDDGDDDRMHGSENPGAFAGRPTGQPGSMKRHFTTSSGPGKLGSGGLRMSGPGSLGPASNSLSRKRTHDGAPARETRTAMFAFEDPASPGEAAKAFKDSDDEDTKNPPEETDRAPPKPTLHLSSLPPRLSPSFIRSMFPESLKIDAIKLLTPPRLGNTDRKSSSAIVTLAHDTPATELDNAVSLLQNRYLGWGHYLSLSRYLSSAALNPASMSGMGDLPTLPFGAKATQQGPAASLSRAPPPQPLGGGAGRGFAAPSSYGPRAFGRGAAPLQVEVKPPTDIKQLKLIHMTVESVISHGPEFEALLMSRPSVQREEKWAWIWDPRSVGGVWYRWRLWDILTGAQQRIRRKRPHNDSNLERVFEGEAVWMAQERALAFEYDSNIADFVSESEFDSSEDEESGDEGRQRLRRLQGGLMPQDSTDQGSDVAPSYMNPLQKAKLVHLLARLPRSTAKLRRGDIARLTAFAIKNASEGADEVVDLITKNVHSPFAMTAANPENQVLTSDAHEEDGEGVEKEPPDQSSMKLIALYVISDILSSSSTSGVRHAWRYRQLFEASFRAHSTFAHLGRLERELSWGRLRAEKFRRSINGLLSLWEGWCVFPAVVHEDFAQTFNEPPLTEQEQRQEAAKKEDEEKRRKAVNRWRTVDESAKESTEASAQRASEGAMEIDNVDGEPLAEDGEDVDGTPMAEDEDLDGEPMPDQEDLDGQPMADSSDDNEEHAEPAIHAPNPDADMAPSASGPEEARNARLRRPKAEDMFADSDSE